MKSYPQNNDRHSRTSKKNRSMKPMDPMDHPKEKRRKNNASKKDRKVQGSRDNRQEYKRDNKQDKVNKQDRIIEHKKEAFPKPGNMLYPIPAVMVTCQDAAGNNNIITVAWTGTICSDPPMLSISVRKERYSYSILRDTGEFVVNLTTRQLVRQADYCGVKSGRDVNKFAECGLTPSVSQTVRPPGIEESPVSLECRVRDVIELGSHDLFLAEILCVQVDTAYMDEKGRFSLEDTDLAAYSHGRYYTLGEELGRFGFSVQKKKKKKR